MKLYLKITKMNFEEDAIEHNIIRGISDKEFLGYDEIVESPDKIDIKERNTWWSFPLYEFKDGEIIPFDYTKYAYFHDTDRRNMLAGRINQIYNPPSELKILRKTIKYLMDELNISIPDFFQKYNDKVEAIINKNPKEVKNGRIRETSKSTLKYIP